MDETLSFLRQCISHRNLPRKIRNEFDTYEKALVYIASHISPSFYTMEVKSDGKVVLTLLKRDPGVIYQHYMWNKYNRDILKRIRFKFFKEGDKLTIVDVGGGHSPYTDVLDKDEVFVFDLFDYGKAEDSRQKSVSTGGGCWQIPHMDVQLLRREKTHYNYGDCTRLPLKSETGDIVLCFEVLEHLPSEKERINLLMELKRILKKGGILIFHTPNTHDLIGRFKSITKDKKFEHHGIWDDKTMISNLKEFFKILSVEGTILEWNFMNRLLGKFPFLVCGMYMVDSLLTLLPLGWKLKYQTVIIATK